MKLKVIRKFMGNDRLTFVPSHIDYDKEKLEDFGKTVIFQGDVYEWVMYDKGPVGYDYELIYTMSSRQRVAVDEIISLAPWDRECECGSRKLGHPGHSDWCKAN